MKFWPFPERAERKPLFSDQDKDNLSWFWHGYFKSKTPWLIAVLGMVMVQGLVYQQFISLTETGLRVIFENGDVGGLIKVCFMVFGIFAMRALMSFLVPRVSIWLASDAVLRMRQDLIDHMMILDLAYFERTSSGDIILRLVNQAHDLSDFVGQTTVSAVRDVATVVIVSGYLIYKSPILFLSTIFVMPFVPLMVRFVSNKIKHIQQSAENAMGAYMTGIEEMSNGMRTVKISNQEPVEKQRLFKATAEIKDLSIRLQSAQALMMPTVDILSALVFILIIGGGGYMALSGNFDMDGASIVAFMIGMALIFDPARRVAHFFVKLQASLVILDGVRSLFREVPSITNMEGAVSEFDAHGDIVFDGVDFQYKDKPPLFQDLSLSFESGKVSAIVGATGSGKTTILSLMARLYDVQGGEVTIGGMPVNQLRIPVLRQSFSVVAQDIVIFNSSIWENIRYVKPEASDDEIWAAATHVGIDGLIRERGDAPLGPKGAQLSGGQKQRVAIARAFLRSAPILLLDEATSALDQRTEDKVKAAIGALSEGKTTIIVAHRLSAVTQADCIYVLDEGRVVEQGTHSELMAMAGLYAGMYGAQRQSYG
ncbi:ABC transporter ATP-binding protein [Sulfitobacter sp. F26204]|uniref:ABC transporter ATP-binding protein n=1 Tax=Sulfitobacter sp. F26204 TaxID=2996014 RepID=UPI00225E0E4A|nr:ABC transporter ATP-binding protein [Sulfitobacter sp. F26204]MCX7561847.1 ABC transporter ATP-binding protein [Sulfitobacter sp. F26204]